jgi:hypothetical protein
MTKQEAFVSKNKLSSQFSDGLNNAQVSDVINQINDYDSFRHDYISSDATYFSDDSTLSFRSRTANNLSAEKTNDIKLNQVANWFANRIKTTNRHSSSDGDDVFFRVRNTINIGPENLKYFNYEANIDSGYTFGPNELGTIFDYSYDLTIGNLTKIDHSMSIGKFFDKNAIDINLDFSNSILGPLNQHKPLNYSIGNIFPNYTLLAKVTKVDLETNSHYAYLVLELGIKDDLSNASI